MTVLSPLPIVYPMLPDIGMPRVLMDVLPLVCNVLGQLLMSTAYMEQWVFWIGVNVFSLAMWGNTLANDPGSSYAHIYLVKYGFYLINSINGLRNWLILSRRQSEPEAIPEASAETPSR